MVPDGNRYCLPHRGNNRAMRAENERNAGRRSHGLKRLYDSAAWRVRVRQFILARDTLCRIGILCQGRGLSTDVDHIIRAELYIEQHEGDVTFFFDPENLRGACQADHSRKTSLENRGLWREADCAPGSPD